jgi:hypothetical protein
MHHQSVFILLVLILTLAACGGESDSFGEDLSENPDTIALADVVGSEDTLLLDDTSEADTANPGEDTIEPLEDVVEPSDLIGEDVGEDVGEDTVLACDPPQVSPDFVGVAKCKECHAGMHPEVIEAWDASGHGYKLNPVINGVPPVYPDFVGAWYAENDFELLPGLGMTWNEVIYVIGGYGWKARFIGTDGYIVTGNEDNPNVQFNLDTKEWVPYHTGEQKAYNCGSCHTTGWVAADPDCPPNIDQPGFHGVYKDPQISCEACHGAGAAHVASGKAEDIGDAKDSCKNCHIRGDDMGIIPASGGLIKHHEQYQELLAGPHDGLSCGACHDAHASTKYDDEAPGEGVHTGCESCHSDIVVNAPHAGIASCTACHMPKTVKSATSFTFGEGDDALKLGDIGGHIFKLTTEEGATLTFINEEDDAEVASDAIPVLYGCKECHPSKTAAQAIESAPHIHGN